MINREIDILIRYAQLNLGLKDIDVIYTRNKLLDLCGEIDYKESIDNTSNDNIEFPDEVVNPIIDYLINKNKIDESLREEYFSRIMDVVSLKPSEIESKFNELYESSPFNAFKYLYNYSIKCGYVKAKAIMQNIRWNTTNTLYPLEITINLSKPEKSLKDIKRAASVKEYNYPDCVICKENVGYIGHGTIRNNLRGKTINVGGAPWFFQYSPYGYFNEHSILISDKHIKMNVESESVNRLFDFIDYIPEYFIGFNASLPIVGGSILAHDHYQGGRYSLPMMDASIKKCYKFDGIDAKVSLLNWYNNVFRIEGLDRSEVYKASKIIIESWLSYDDSEYNIISKDIEQHNSITGIARKNKDNYIIDLILRNNQTSTEYPEGIYHAHPEYYNIKSESIGLIEAAGMFILPARLKRQLNTISEILSGSNVTLTDDMNIHKDMITRLTNKYGINNSIDDSHRIVRDEVNKVCENILYNTRIFKDDEKGNRCLNKYIRSITLKEI